MNISAWRRGEFSAAELSERIHQFKRGPERELWSMYNARIDDFLVARAIVIGLLPRETIPAELSEALQQQIAFYEHDACEAATPAEEQSQTIAAEHRQG